MNSWASASNPASRSPCSASTPGAFAVSSPHLPSASPPSQPASTAPSPEADRAIFESAIRALTPHPPDLPIIQAARSLIHSGGTLPVRSLASAADLSERQFRRRFQTATGLSPKEFARVRRVLAAVVQMLAEPEDGLASVAADSGYADQSHLTREVVTVFGGPPTSVTARLRKIDHRNVW